MEPPRKPAAAWKIVPADGTTAAHWLKRKRRHVPHQRQLRLQTTPLNVLTEEGLDGAQVFPYRIAITSYLIDAKVLKLLALAPLTAPRQYDILPYSIPARGGLHPPPSTVW